MLRSLYPFAICLAASAAASPLTVYDDANLSGAGIIIPNALEIYSGSEIPGNLDNAISSFRLDAGYMAIMAVEPDGLGPGKTFIADGVDLVVNALPAELDNALSFIRIVPWKATLKKGNGGDWSGDTSVDASWYYLWSYQVDNGQAIDSREYVPMSWGAGATGDDDIPNYLAMDQASHLLGFNESDNCNDQSGQFSNLCDVPTAVGFYRNLQKAGLRLGSPATREEGAINDTGWLAQFMEQSAAADIRVDYVALHWYDWSSSPALNPSPPANNIFVRFKRYLSNAYHRHRKPLWITEFNANPNRATNIQDEFMALALPYLESVGYVERYAWFQPNSGTGDFFDSQQQLTTTGQIYKDHVSTPAYAPDFLPSEWSTHEVGSPNLSGTTIHSRGTFTVCGSGSGIGGGSDAFHYAYQPLQGDGSIVAYVESVLERGNSKAGLMIRESLDAGSKHASLFLTESGQAAFQSRSTSDGATESVTQSNITTPYWLKLERSEDTITGSISTDGENWTELDSKTISMEADLYIGLASSSQNANTYCDAVFKNLALDNFPDSDGDLISDNWENSFFGDLTTANGEGSDFDKDTFSDLEEYLFGTDPKNPESFFRPILSDAGSGYLEITFDALSGLTYTLEVSESSAPDSWASVNNIAPSTDGPQSLDFTHPDSPDILFGRIKVGN